MPIPPGIFQAFVILSVLAVGICQKDPEKTSAQGWDTRGGYVPPKTPNWHPVLTQSSPKIDTLF